MSLSCRQQRLLKGIDDAVCRSDPRLASMLAIFGQLTAGEQMPGREQLRTPALSRAWAALLAAATAAAALLTRAAGACARGLAAPRPPGWPGTIPRDARHRPGHRPPARTPARGPAGRARPRT